MVPSETFNPRNRKNVRFSPLSNKREALRSALRDTLADYIRCSKVNGIWMLRERYSVFSLRIAWTGVLLGLVTLGICLSLQLWKKFYSYPILYTIGTYASIVDVAFPGITVCNPKVVNFEKVQKFVRRLNIPAGVNVQDVVAGFEYINGFTDRNWTGNSAGFEAADTTLVNNNISIYEAAVEISAGCDDFFEKCFWTNREFPCKQDDEYLSFVASTSFLGPCCSFNYNPKNDSYVPFSANTFGMEGGLSFVGREGSENNKSTGLILFVHHPKDYATEAAATVPITPKSESFVEVIPTYQSCSIEVMELAKSKRDCLVAEDVGLRYYRQASCLVACQAAAMFKACGCHPYHLPTVANEFNRTECKLKDALCIASNFDNFKNLNCAECLPNCFDVTYKTSSYYTGLKQHNYSVSAIYKEADVNKGRFIVRVYMAKQMVPSVRKVTVMSWISLLSDLGGVFNLCLGISAISMVEFIYYFTFELRRNYMMRCVLIMNKDKQRPAISTFKK